MKPTSPLPSHHKHCDDLFADAETAARDRRWTDAKGLFVRFQGEMLAHFATEEEVLFPAFEGATGMTGGPTQMMRFEHAQMKDLLADMASAIADGDGERYAGAGETLLVLMQQHNLKEENILYPMCDRALGGRDLALEQALRSRADSACRN